MEKKKKKNLQIQPLIFKKDIFNSQIQKIQKITQIKQQINPIHLYNPPYESSWFETENKVSLDKYIKRLFSISKKHFKSNAHPDTIKGLLVPHAGIRYSGLCSASAYSQIIGRTHPIKRIILLCTNHQSSDNFISTSYTDISSYNSLEKIESLKIDTKQIEYLKSYLEINDTRFLEEHSFFNQLPFIETIVNQQIQEQLKHQKTKKNISPVLLLPLLISNNTNLMNSKIRLNIKKILLTLIELLKNQDTILICTSDLSHINGHFENKVKSYIYQNIRKNDNEILQFIYDGVNGVNNRNQKIDDVLFIQNAPSCGTMALYFFAKMLNVYSGGLDYSSSSSSSSSSSDSKSPTVNRTTPKKIWDWEWDSESKKSRKKIVSRVCCYYTSLMRDNINIYDTDITNNFNPLELIKELSITDISQSSVSYAGLIFTTQPYIEFSEDRKIKNMFSQYEKLALIGLVKEQLYNQFNNQIYKNHNKQNKIPSLLILPINSQSFTYNLGVYISIYEYGKLRACSGTTETNNIDFTILTNIKKLTSELSIKNSILYISDLLICLFVIIS